MNHEVDVTDIESELNEEVMERVQILLNREPGHLELEIFKRLWSEDCSGKYSKNLFSELKTDSSHSLKDYPDILEIGDNYQLMFSVTECRHKTEPYFAEHGARSVASSVLVNGGSRDDLVKLIEPVALNAYATGIPLLSIIHTGISQKDAYMKVASLGLSRNRKAPITILTTPGAEIWWLYSGNNVSSEEREIKTIHLNDLMIAMSAHPWLLAARHVSSSGILCSLADMTGEGRRGVFLNSESWDQEPAEFLMSKDPGGFLVCFRRTFEREIKELINRYNVDFMPLGRSTDDGKLTIQSRDQESAVIPFDFLIRYSGEPIAHNESERVLEVKNKHIRKDFSIPEPKDLNEVIKKLIGSPNLHFPRNYPCLVDSTIRGNTLKMNTE
ncbi:MAG TPA: hypothetical protein ENO01_03305, partial [Candidatus Marinimicrobia bacterium]|nr:hypothetical protein [Candidatus Neomarinimicrobiota bacterium]